MLPDRLEHGAEHLRRQLAGVGVVARAVEAVEEGKACSHVVAGAVREREGGFASGERCKRAVVGDAPESEDGGKARHGGRAFTSDPLRGRYGPVEIVSHHFYDPEGKRLHG